MPLTLAISETLFAFQMDKAHTPTAALDTVPGEILWREAGNLPHRGYRTGVQKLVVIPQQEIVA